MTTDPVCHMEVDEESADFRSNLAGTEYYFCSQECKDEFENNPEEYSAAA